ncbi:hypothetical protein KIN20_023926 [Parelaphostrongylus tenuis]|uniref:Uncharacterized protein n=1 Tax=Parelaphostrongylus tenuis TaxID=148309 RepID=A0AAD5QTA3_PARTN|nr:hypothetical protein KIN20_023926 [Parelaphostrongylus tenuis]
MLNKYRFGSSTAETFRRNNEAWGDGAVGRTAVFDRFDEVKAQNGGLMHKKRAGKPQEFDREAALNATETSTPLTTCLVADDFECSHAATEDNPEKWEDLIVVEE